MKMDLKNNIIVEEQNQQKLENIIKEKDIEIAEFSKNIKEIDDLKSKILILENNKIEFEKKFDQYNKEINENEQTISELEYKIMLQKNRLTDINENLSNKLRLKEQEIDDFKSKSESKSLENLESKNSKEKSEESNQNFAFQIGVHETKISELQKENMALHADQQVISDKNVNLMNLIKEQEDVINEMNESKNNFKEEKEKAAELIDTLQTQISGKDRELQEIMSINEENKKVKK
jgi:chromosome segregation ATPase